MNRNRYKTWRKDAKTQSWKPSPASASLRLCAIISILASTGCRKSSTLDYSPGELTISCSMDKEVIQVGDPVALTVTAVYPTNGIVDLPELDRPKDLVQLKRSWESTPLEGGHVRLDTTYSLTSFNLGEHVISTHPIVYRHLDQVTTNAFPELTLKVESSLNTESSTTIADIKGIQKLPGRIPPWLWIALLVALTAFLIGRLTSRLWKKREEEKPSPPPIPADIIARQALDALKRSGLLEQGECNAFYTELSLILRTYLEGRFHLNAPDETTEEIVEEMSRSGALNGTQRNILQEFMRQADMVKFAKGHPERTTMESAYTTTEQFVEETTQTTEGAEE